MYRGRNLQAFSNEIGRRETQKIDYGMPANMLSLDSGRITFFDGGGAHSYPMTTLAQRQISRHTGVPQPYVNRMQEHIPGLWEKNVNSWLERDQTDRMVRTLDGYARAFLSTRYNYMLDNFDICKTVMPILRDTIGIDDNSVSCEVTERYMYLKVINFRVSAEVSVGDIVYSGIMITNSEVGLGQCVVAPFVFRKVCSNGMIIDTAAHKKRHIGKAVTLDSKDFRIYRPDTVQAAHIAYMKQIRDNVYDVMREEGFDKIVDTLRDAQDKKFTGNNLPSIVDITLRTNNVPLSARDDILSLWMHEEKSVYGLAQAYTAYSKSVDNYDYATQLEGVGGNIITMPNSEYHRLNNVTPDDVKRARKKTIEEPVDAEFELVAV